MDSIILPLPLLPLPYLWTTVRESGPEKYPPKPMNWKRHQLLCSRLGQHLTNCYNLFILRSPSTLISCPSQVLISPEMDRREGPVGMVGVYILPTQVATIKRGWGLTPDCRVSPLRTISRQLNKMPGTFQAKYAYVMQDYYESPIHLVPRGADALRWPW